MGLGGNLMWSAVLADLFAESGTCATVVHAPKLTDLLCGRLYDASAELASDPVLRFSPHAAFIPARQRPAAAHWLDGKFRSLLSLLRLRRPFERAVLARARAVAGAGGPRYVHLDLEIHSYAERQRGNRLVWKAGGHAIQTMLRRLSSRRSTLAPCLWLTPEERAAADRLLAESGVKAPFLVVEPETNPEFFGDLRAWPFERWAALAARLSARGHRLVQIGLADARRIEGTVDLRGRTGFREVAAVIGRARLFLGTESGLMHTARAMGTDAVILWGGVTLPEFAGYPDHHAIVCHRVSCAPCGNLGWCDNGRICMGSITVDEVEARVVERLSGSRNVSGAAAPSPA